LDASGGIPPACFHLKTPVNRAFFIVFGVERVIRMYCFEKFLISHKLNKGLNIMGIKILKIYIENSVIGQGRSLEMNREKKKFDCVKFKYESQGKLLKDSRARNYVNM
jgi:hypothetical protein